MGFYWYMNLAVNMTDEESGVQRMPMGGYRRDESSRVKICFPGDVFP